MLQSACRCCAVEVDNRRLLRLAVLSAAVIAMLLSSQASAAPTTVTVGPWDVTFYNDGDRYRDGSLHYTGAKNWSADEIADVTAMLNVWDASIGNAAPSRQLKLTMLWGNLGTNVLGSSLNPLHGDYTNAWTNVEYVWREGKDLTATSDAFIQLGTGITWHSGSSLPASNEIDLRSVVLHEVGHSLGFYDSYSPDKFWIGGLTAWDTNLRDAATGGNMPAPGSSGTPGNFNQGANPVYFIGTNAKSAYGGNPVPIYAPTQYEAGSSLAHLDDAHFPDALMKHAIGYGDYVRQPTVVEWRIMQDLGWDVNLQLLPGDANRDGQVDVADYTIYFNNYGTGLQWEQGNFHGNGTTDVSDYTAWFNNYGATLSGASAVPEPGTVGVVIMLGMMLLGPNRRPK